jgi:nucleotide-binding universal stress UspA family protein
MNRYKNILVGLGDDQRDELIIRYAGLIARMAQTEEITFAHIRSSGGAPGPSDDSTPPQPVALLREELDGTVREAFDGPPGIQVKTRVEEGSVLDEMLDLARTTGADLIVLGQGTHAGAFSEHVARKAPCSVVILPADAAPAVERVLVPVDFSEHAAGAVDAAVAFAEAAGLSEVHLLHVYGTPGKVDRFHENSTYALRRRAEETAKRFLADRDLRGLEPVLHFVIGLDVPEAIGKAVQQVGADLLVVGARGRTPGAALLMGSVAEALVRHVTTPLVAVKKKGVTLKLLDALLERSSKGRFA